MDVVQGRREESLAALFIVGVVFAWRSEGRPLFYLFWAVRPNGGELCKKFSRQRQLRQSFKNQCVNQEPFPSRVLRRGFFVRGKLGAGVKQALRCGPWRQRRAKKLAEADQTKPDRTFKMFSRRSANGEDQKMKNA